MTLKQIQQRVKSYEKEMDKRTTRVLFYSERAAKLLASLNRAGVPVTKDEATSCNFYTMVDKYGVATGTPTFQKLYSLFTSCGYLKENSEKLESASKCYEKYLLMLGQAEKTTKDKKTATMPVLSALTAQFAPFEETYHEQAIVAHTALYKRAQERKIELKHRLDEIHDELMNLSFSDRRRRPLMSERSEIQNTLGKRQYRISTLEDYLADIEEDLRNYWQSSIKKLADKLTALKVDENNISVNEPECTGRGFETLIKEGDIRVFDARLIWAAEGSELVTPHFRYIVTERKL